MCLNSNIFRPDWLHHQVHQQISHHLASAAPVLLVLLPPPPPLVVVLGLMLLPLLLTARMTFALFCSSCITISSFQVTAAGISDAVCRQLAAFWHC
jgi:hypothetical protein